MAKMATVDLGKKGSFEIKKGELHRKLGIPKKEKIPASKLKPKPGDSPALRREKASAKGLKAMHHGGASAKKDERRGEEKHMEHKRAATRHESRGMKNAMHRGEAGNHMATGAHEGRVMGMKKR